MQTQPPNRGHFKQWSKFTCKKIGFLSLKSLYQRLNVQGCWKGNSHIGGGLSQVRNEEGRRKNRKEQKYEYTKLTSLLFMSFVNLI